MDRDFVLAALVWLVRLPFRALRCLFGELFGWVAVLTGIGVVVLAVEWLADSGLGAAAVPMAVTLCTLAIALPVAAMWRRSRTRLPEEPPRDAPR